MHTRDTFRFIMAQSTRWNFKKWIRIRTASNFRRTPTITLSVSAARFHFQWHNPLRGLGCPPTETCLFCASVAIVFCNPLLVVQKVGIWCRFLQKGSGVLTQPFHCDKYLSSWLHIRRDITDIWFCINSIFDTFNVRMLEGVRQKRLSNESAIR